MTLLHSNEGDIGIIYFIDYILCMFKDFLRSVSIVIVMLVCEIGTSSFLNQKTTNQCISKKRNAIARCDCRQLTRECAIYGDVKHIVDTSICPSARIFRVGTWQVLRSTAE